jgi:hypothetical protein
MPYNSFFDNGRMQKLLHNIAQVKMSMEDFFSRCNRLTGYGLVLPLERRPDALALDERAYRITVLGRRLVDILLRGKSIDPVI